MESMRPAFALADVWRIFDETRNHEDSDNTDRDVDVESPPPAVLVGEPTAECGAEDGSDDYAQAEDSHGYTTFGWRKTLEQDRLRERL